MLTISHLIFETYLSVFKFMIFYLNVSPMRMVRILSSVCITCFVPRK